MKQRMYRRGTITTDWLAKRVDMHIAQLQKKRRHVIKKERYSLACTLLGVHQLDEVMLQMLDMADGLINMCENRPGAK